MANTKMAVPELAKIQIKSMNRSAFMARATLAAGAVYGGAAIGPFVRRALAQEGTDGQEGRGDVNILNFALTLEYLEAEFYKEALEKVPGLSGDTLKLTQEIRATEGEHVTAIAAVIKSLGGKPVAKPAVDFGDAFKSRDAYLDLAETFEDTGVSAYNGAGPLLQSKDVLATAGTIAQIEGRHAALIRLLRNHTITPSGALDDVATIDEVTQKIKPFLP